MRSPIGGRLLACGAFGWCLFAAVSVYAQGSTNDWRETWFSAVQTGDLKVVTGMLREGVNPRVYDKKGEGSLSLAAAYGHLPVVASLLDAGIPVDDVNSLGVTALMRAAACGHVDIVKLLLERKSAVNQKDLRWLTALNYAVLGKRADVMKVLLAAGADPNNVGLDGRACMLYVTDSKLAEELIVHRADVNVQDPQTGSTLLIYAAVNGKLDLVKILVEAKANINARDAKGGTALFGASARGHTEIVEFLWKHGADLEASEAEQKTTPLMIAAQNGHSPIVKMLMAGGAQVNSKDKYGATAVLHAQEKGYTRIVEMLTAVGGQDGLFAKGKPTLLLAKQTLVELKQIEDACEQYLMEVAHPSPPALNWTNLEPYILPGTPLHARKGRDVIGNVFVLESADSVPRIAKASQDEFNECLKKSSITAEEFWGKYASQASIHGKGQAPK